MRFTRKIPGIRPPIPGREGVVAPSSTLFVPAQGSALVFVFLNAILGIYLLCTLRFGGEMSLIWLEPRALGLSLFTIASAVNGMFVLLFVGTYFLQRGERRDWKRALGVLFAVALLGCTQLFFNGWKQVAELDRDRSLAALEELAEELAGLRAEAARHTDLPWVGEYSTGDGQAERRMILLPRAAGLLFWLARHESAGPLLRAKVPLTAYAARDRVIVERVDGRYHAESFALVEAGERRYLVKGAVLDAFLSAGGDPELDDAIFLRVGDEGRPSGARRVVTQLE